jgi:hypothetical protein
VVTHGPAVTLRVARRLMTIAVLGALALTVAGVYPRLTLLAYPGFAAAPPGWPAGSAQPGGGGPGCAVGCSSGCCSRARGLLLAWVDYWFC